MLLVRTSKASLQGMLRDLTLACPNYIIHTSILSMRRSKNAGAKRPGSLIRELTYLMRYFYESRCGIEGKDFNRAWHLDPEEPQIANLMSVYEKDVYQKIAVSNRACAVQSEINMLVGELSEEVLHQEQFSRLAYEKTEDAMNQFKGIARIVGTPVPTPYTHMLYTAVCVYVFLTPVVEIGKIYGRSEAYMYATGQVDNSYHEMTFLSGWASGIMSTMCFYGLLETAAKLQVGWSGRGVGGSAESAWQTRRLY